MGLEVEACVQAKPKSQKCGLSRLNPEMKKPAKREFGTVLARPTEIGLSRLNPNLGKEIRLSWLNSTFHKVSAYKDKYATSAG